MEPDVTLIVAVQRHQTGANVHALNNLLARYVFACSADKYTVADRARHELVATLVEDEAKRSCPAQPSFPWAVR